MQDAGLSIRRRTTRANSWGLASVSPTGHESDRHAQRAGRAFRRSSRVRACRCCGEARVAWATMGGQSVGRRGGSSPARRCRFVVNGATGAGQLRVTPSSELKVSPSWSLRAKFDGESSKQRKKKEEGTERYAKQGGDEKSRATDAESQTIDLTREGDGRISSLCCSSACRPRKRLRPIPSLKLSER